MAKEWIEIATVGIALYAAGLSTYTWYVQRRDRRPQVKSVMEYAVIPPGIVDPGEDLVAFTASNPGDRLVVLTSHHLSVPGKQNLHTFDHTLPGDRLPCELQPGQKCTLLRKLETLKEGLREAGFRGKVKVRSVFVDATGNRYCSKSFTLDVDEPPALPLGLGEDDA